jgi:hypothetical protein
MRYIDAITREPLADLVLNIKPTQNLIRFDSRPGTVYAFSVYKRVTQCNGWMCTPFKTFNEAANFAELK